jgi:hypothetical protein
VITMPSHRALIIEDRVVVPDAAFDQLRLPELGQGRGLAHNTVKTAVTFGVIAFVREHELGEVYPDGMLVTQKVPA